MFIWDKFDPADNKSAKRSLLAFSIATLLLANTTIVSEELSILGLVFEVSQPRLIALGQLLSFSFLVLYLIKEIPHLLISFQLWSIGRLKKKHDFQQRNLADHWGYPGHDQYEDGPNGEFKELEDRHKWEQSNVERRFDPIIASFRVIAETTTRYLIPVATGILASCYPYSLDKLTSYLVTFSM